MKSNNMREFFNQDMMVASLIGSSLDFQTFYTLPLVADLDEKDAMVLFSCMTKHTFPEGKIIYHSGEPSVGKMYLILQGKVQVNNESGYKFRCLRQGDVFGLFSFLDESRTHSATLVVEKELTVLTLDRAYFDLIAVEEPKLGHELMRFMFRLLSKKALELEVEYAHIHNFAFGGKM